MNLEHPGYLWLLLCIPLFLCYSLISYRQASKWLFRFAHTTKRPIPHVVATACLSLALTTTIFSLAEPKLQYNRVVFNRSGIDVAIGIDVSKSMLAEDVMLPEEGKKLFVAPNRLNRARHSALTILSAMRGERVAVFMFASKGVSIVPLTSDYAYCQYIIKHVNDATIAIPGSDLSQAIATGVSLFEEDSRKSVKIIILISDGEDISDDRSAVYEAAHRAAVKRIAIYTVGTGMGQGVMIPIRDAIGGVIEGYYQDEDGTYLKTRLEQETLKSIATITGGRYFRAQGERSEEDIVEALLSYARTTEYTKVSEPAWFHLSPILLFAALIFFVVAMIAGC